MEYLTFLNITTIVVTIVVTISFIAWKRKSLCNSTLQSIATSIGITGTFVGILIGLSGLSLTPNELNASIEKLIGGLVISFTTSIFGIFVSIVIKLTPDFFGKEEEAGGGEGESTRDLLEAIVKSLSGGEDDSLLSQIKILRTDIKDGFKGLSDSFNTFAQEMAKNNVEALIKAIKEVMEDFNTVINDRLGDTFRELSQSVEQLVEWQKEYRAVVVSATNALGDAQESLKNSADNLNNTATTIATIAENNQKIASLQQEFSAVVENLNQMLGASVGFSQGMQSLSNELQGSGETIRKEIRQLVNESMESAQQQNNEAIKNIRTLAEETSQKLSDSNKETFEELQKRQMDVLENFGRHMASISEKLSSDYAELANKLTSQN